MNWEEYKYLLYAFLLLFTVGSYAGSVWLFRRTRFPLLHPLITTVAAIILLLLATGIPSEYYVTATMPIDFLLGPTVVALGYALYEQKEHLQANLASILTSVVVGSLVGILSVLGVLWLFGSSPDVIASMLPKSVTNPIAIPLAQRYGGIGGLTAVVVVATGIFGGIIGPAVLRVLGITSKIAKGLALGTAAHGVGTARAMEMGALEGAIAGLAIGLMGLATAVIVPVIYAIIN